MPRGNVKIPIPPPTGGLQADQAEWLQPIASLADGSNVVIRDGKLYIRSGFRKLDTTGFGERVMGGIFYQLAAGTKLTVAGGITKRKQFTAGAWSDITGSAWTGTGDDHARFVNFPLGTTVYVIGVNGKDATIEWDGAAGTDNNLAGGAPVAKDVTAAANRVIYGNVTSGGIAYPYAFMHSAFNNHQSTPALNLVQVGEAAGIVVAVRNVGVQAFALYTERGQFVVSAQGGSAPFRVDYRSGQPGPCSPAAVVQAGEGVHYYMGTDANFYQFDGTACRPIGNKVRAKTEASLNPNYRYRTHGVYDRTFREIHWFWVPLGSTTISAGITYSLDTQVWSPIHSFNRNLSASWEWDEQNALVWTGLSGTWTALGSTYPTWLSMGRPSNPTQLLGQEGGQTYILGGQSTDDGDAISAEWRYPIKAPTGHGRICRADAVESYFKQLQTAMNLSVRLGTAPYAGATVTLQAAQTFDMSSADVPLATYENVEGRFLMLKYLVTEDNQGLEFHGALAYLYDRGVAA